MDSRDACLVSLMSSYWPNREHICHSQREAGELITAGCTATDLVEVGEFVTRLPGSSEWAPKHELVELVRSAGDVTIFKSVGVGIQDVAIACIVVDRAELAQIGVVVDNFDTDN